MPTDHGAQSHNLAALARSLLHEGCERLRHQRRALNDPSPRELLELANNAALLAQVNLVRQPNRSFDCMDFACLEDEVARTTGTQAPSNTEDLNPALAEGDKRRELIHNQLRELAESVASVCTAQPYNQVLKHIRHAWQIIQEHEQQAAFLADFRNSFARVLLSVLDDEALLEDD